jgi:hypothetical protein
MAAPTAIFLLRAVYLPGRILIIGEDKKISYKLRKGKYCLFAQRPFISRNYFEKYG